MGTCFATSYVIQHSSRRNKEAPEVCQVQDDPTGYCLSKFIQTYLRDLFDRNPFFFLKLVLQANVFSYLQSNLDLMQ